MYSLTRGHYFLYGNKCKASMLLFDEEWLLITVLNDNLFNTSIKVTKDDLDQNQIAKWLKNNSHR